MINLAAIRAQHDTTVVALLCAHTRRFVRPCFTPLLVLAIPGTHKGRCGNNTTDNSNNNGIIAAFRTAVSRLIPQFIFVVFSPRRRQLLLHEHIHVVLDSTTTNDNEQKLTAREAM